MKAPDFEVVLSLRDFTKRVFSDRSTAEGAKSIFARAASGQATSLFFKIFLKDRTVEVCYSQLKNDKIKNATIISKNSKCLAHEVFPTGHPCKY